MYSVRPEFCAHYRVTNLSTLQDTLYKTQWATVRENVPKKTKAHFFQNGNQAFKEEKFKVFSRLSFLL